MLSNCIEAKISVNVFLINGVRLRGVISGYGNDVITLNDNNNGGIQIIYKHAVSTISLNPK
jgi:host factor-I protein